jgi:Pentapeptide repeats (8 copies)
MPNMRPRESSSSQAKLKLEIEKLALETDKLARDRTCLSRAASTITPLITAFVAILGVVLSLFTLWQQGRDRLQDANEKAFQMAMSMATDPQGLSDRRISGIYQLNRFWGEDDKVPVIAATITSLLLLPDTLSGASNVRCAAAAAIAEGYQAQYSATRKIDLPRLLYGDARLGSLGLISYQNLLLRQSEGGVPDHQTIGELDEINNQNIQCKSPLAATREAIRKGWSDLAHTNLQQTNLVGAQLYAADLTGANLDRAWLFAANLRCANLANSYVDGLSLDRSTKFFFTNVSHTKAGLFKPSFPVEGTISITNEQWREWRDSGFKFDILKKYHTGASLWTGRASCV